jgi:putative salt-induced outer membrane protein
MMQNSALKLKFVLVVLSVLICQLANADQVTTKNGDRISGKILKSDGKSLTIQSDLAGPIIVPWDAVEQISSPGTLFFTLKDGKVVSGAVTTVDGQFEVATAESGKVVIAKEMVDAVRSPEEQAIVERLKHPGFFELWAGAFDFGLALAEGNSETTNLSLALNADRATNKDKTSFYAVALYSTNSTTGESITTANVIRGGGRYEYNVSPRFFVYGFGGLEHDELQQLDLRILLGGGAGWHVYKTEATFFDIFGGLNWNQEYYDNDFDRSSAEAQLGEELSHQLSERVLLKQGFVVFPNLSDTGEYRMAFDASAVTNLNKWLGWQITVSDRYTSNPLPGIKKNDLILTTGLHIAFAS